MKKVILHCGSPKTGSTSLQYYFLKHENILQKHNIYYPHRFISAKDVDPLHEAFNKATLPQSETDSIIAARARLRNIFLDNVSTILVSNEMLLGDPIIYPREGFFPNNIKMVSILQKIFDGYDVSVKYFVRDYASFISSYYVQYVRRGGYCSLEGFLNSIGTDNLSWENNIKLLKRAFGDQQVSVFSYDDFKNNHNKIINLFFDDYIGGNFSKDLLSEYNFNESVGGISLFLTRLCNKVLVDIFNLDPRKAGDITRNKVLKFVAKITPSTKPELPEALREELFEKYTAELPSLLCR